MACADNKERSSQQQKVERSSILGFEKGSIQN